MKKHRSGLWSRTCSSSIFSTMQPFIALHRRAVIAIETVLPNPSLKRSANGMSRWPSSAGPAAHFALAVQRATPLSPA